MLVSRCIAVVALVSSAAAQGNVWVVDFADGPGTDFTELLPAIDAAADGDVLLVRSGVYEVWNTIDGRSLSIVGDGPLVQVSGALTVQNLAADQRVTLRTLILQHPGQVQALHNDGVLWIEDSIVAADLYGGSNEHGAVYALDARVVLQNSHVSGSIQYGFHAAPPTAGLELVDSAAWVSGGSIRGGDGIDTIFPDLPGAPGVVAIHSTLELAGAAVVGGAGQTQPGGVGLIAGGESTVTLTQTTVAGGSGTPEAAAFEVDPGSFVVLGPDAAHGLTSTATPRVGDPLTVTATGPAGDTVVLLVGTAPASATLALGTLLVSPAPPAFATVLGVVPPEGELSASFPVPALGGAPSVALFVQDLHVDGATGALRLGPATAPLLLAAGF